MVFKDWNTDAKYAEPHDESDLKGLDLEGHLNRDHSFRLNDLMGEDYDTKLRLHRAEHAALAGRCPHCGHEMEV